MTPVWLYTDRARPFPWCVLSCAIVGGRITTLCKAGDGHEAALPYGEVLITTEFPVGLACPACVRHLGVTTRGAAVAAPTPDAPYELIEIDTGRVKTIDLRGPTSPGPEVLGDWNDG